MAVTCDDVILVNIVDAIFGMNNESRRSLGIINMDLIMICGLGEEYCILDTNNNYFDLDDYDSLDVLAALMETHSQDQDQKNPMKKGKQILKGWIEKEK